MVRVEQALRIVLELINTLPPKEVKLTQSLDRILAEDIYADMNIPALDNSAMDGYALQAFDTKQASKDDPRILEVVEDLQAGYLPAKEVGKNQAISIMTGAVIPQGADSVIIVENTEKEKNNKVKILKEVEPGKNIRRAGEDIKKGEQVLEKGTLLNPAYIGLLASLGRARIKVGRRPKVAVLATGDEVIDVNERLEPAKLYSSNTYTLYSQILKCGATPKNLGIARDKAEELEKKISEGLDCDLILISGGVSVGDYDLVKVVLARMGTDIKFWRVAMRPGKPVLFGLIKGIPLFGLPGNPVSSMVSFEAFVRPAILKMLGQKIDNRKQVQAVLEEDISKRKAIRYFLRAQTRWENESYLTRTTGPQGSGMLKSMALANSLIILPEEEEHIEKGTRVEVRFLD